MFHRWETAEKHFSFEFNFKESFRNSLSHFNNSVQALERSTFPPDGVIDKEVNQL